MPGCAAASLRLNERAREPYRASGEPLPRIPLTGSIANDAAGRSSLTRFGLALCDHRSGYRGHGTLEDQYRSQARHISAGPSRGDDDIDGCATAPHQPFTDSDDCFGSHGYPNRHRLAHAPKAQICTLDGDGDACQARAGRGNGDGCASGASPGTRGAVSKTPAASSHTRRWSTCVV